MRRKMIQTTKKAYQKMFKKVKNPIEFIWDDENER